MEGDGDVDFATFQKWWHVHESQKWASTMQFFVLFLMYPGLSKMTSDAFSCRIINPEVSVLRADTRISCLSGEFSALRACAAAMFVVFVVGLPLFWCAPPS